MKKLILATIAGLALTQVAVANDATTDAKGTHPHHKGKMFEKMDANKDEVITKEEAHAFHEKRFDEMDANKDGKVTKDEAKAFGDKKKAERAAKKQPLVHNAPH